MRGRLTTPDPTPALKQLEDRLCGFMHVVNTGAAPRPEVVEAIGWLGRCRRDGGYWGEEQEGTTALAMIAFGLWRRAGDTPAGAAANAAISADELLESAAWLASQAREGRWETPWYSAVAIQAMRVAGYQGPALEQGRRYLESLDPSNDQEWGDRVHHAAQILTALAAIDPRHPKLSAWADCIRRNLDARHGPYVCGQAVHALLSSTTTPPADLEVVEPLRQYLRDTPLSKSAFMNYTPALLALAVAREHDELVDEKATELFKKRERGSWYRDAEMTGWALIALHGVRNLTQVVVDKPTFNAAFATAYKTVPEGQRRARRLAVGYTGALMTEIVACVAIVLWGPTDSLLINGVILGMLIGPTMPLIIKGFIKAVK